MDKASMILDFSTLHWCYVLEFVSWPKLGLHWK